MRIIKKNNKTIALVFDGNYKKGTHGVTNPGLPLQVISLNHPKGKYWPAHMHKPRHRVTNALKEVFFITKGRAKVDIVINKKTFKSVTISAGQGILVLTGAIRIKALTDIKALEFKNGPFLEDKVSLE